jgi:aminoglycoside phosphotransferase (APT) family kinase protein
MATGEVIGRGRDAEIVDAGPGLVLRRLIRPRPGRHEAEVMRWVVDHGYPAPRVIEQTAEGMLMQRVDGPTMLDRLGARDVRRNMRTLAQLHAQLHALPVPPGLPTPYGDGPDGSALLHGDLHPGNVILSKDGPVVIDWTNACAGPAGADLATAWLLIACAGLPEKRPARMLEQVGRRMALAALLSAAERLGEQDLARHQLAAVLAERRHDPNMSPGEFGPHGQSGTSPRTHLSGTMSGRR